MATHSLSGKTFILANKHSTQYLGLYLGAIPEETKMRGNQSRAEAMHVTLHAVEDKPNTYNFQCCASGQNNWISFDKSDSSNWLKFSSDKDEAMPIELIDAMKAKNIVMMKNVSKDAQGENPYISFTRDGCWLCVGREGSSTSAIDKAVPVMLEDPDDPAEEPINARLAVENAVDSIPLSDVDNSTQTRDLQQWFVREIATMSGGRLQGKWKDQGWGNPKGGIHARLVDTDGKDLYPWRNIGNFPAPHDWTDIDCEIPPEFFSGEVPMREEVAEFQARRPTPEGARLELAFYVGDGGGHSLHIREASLHIFVHTRMLQAIVHETKIVVRTLGGDELAAINVGAEDSEESRISNILGAVRDALGPGQPFKVIMSGTDQVISG